MSPTTSKDIQTSGHNTGLAELAHSDLSGTQLPTAQRNILMTRPITADYKVENRISLKVKPTRAIDIKIIPAEGVFPKLGVGVQSPFWDGDRGCCNINYRNFDEAAQLWSDARELYKSDSAIMRAHLNDSLVHRNSARFGRLCPGIVQDAEAFDALLEAYQISSTQVQGIYSGGAQQITALRETSSHPFNQLAAIMQDMGDEIHIEDLPHMSAQYHLNHRSDASADTAGRNRILLDILHFAAQPATFLALTTHVISHALCTKLYLNLPEVAALRHSIMHTKIGTLNKAVSFEEVVAETLQVTFAPFHKISDTYDNFCPIADKNPFNPESGCEGAYLKNFELHLAQFKTMSSLTSRTNPQAEPSQDLAHSAIFYVKLRDCNLILINAPCSLSNQMSPATFQFTFPGQELISTQAVVPEETPIPIETLTVESQQEVLAACKESFERARNRVKILREIQQKQKELKLAVNQNPTMYSADELFRIGLENAALLPEAALVIKSYPKVFDLLLQTYKRMSGLSAEID
jgi:hypothetical protein